MDLMPNHFASQTFTPVPAWARTRAPLNATEAAFAAGATLAALDARVRAEAGGLVPFAGVWRCRLALTAAAASARIMRRGEDETKIRDAFYLRAGTADPGPAGRMLSAWRSLDRAAALDPDVVLPVAALFGLRVDDALNATIAEVQKIAGSKEPSKEGPKAPPAAAAQAARLVMTQRPPAELFALWLADAVLSARLKWPRPLPLLAGAVLDCALRRHGEARRPHPLDDDWTTSCCAAYTLAATQACALFDDLAHRSQKLRAIERRLRAKGANAVIEKLHDEDAVPPSEPIAAMSDRALRRLFDRLVTLGAVRELTGRPTFRLYGL